jgi:hypothetical protein
MRQKLRQRPLEAPPPPPPPPGAATLQPAASPAAAALAALARSTHALQSRSTSRDEIGNVLQARGYKRGVELGVQRGVFARETLRRWPRCQEYVLVDAWRRLANYLDAADAPDALQEELYREAVNATAPWAAKVSICRDLTTACAKQFPDAHFDYIYVDARHDYVGVAEDLAAWLPKLRAGGIIAGHDYITQVRLAAAGDARAGTSTATAPRTRRAASCAVPSTTSLGCAACASSP